MTHEHQRRARAARVLPARERIERRVEDEMSAFVHRQCERGTGNELHNVDRGVLIRLRWRRWIAARAGLGVHANWKKHREKQQHATDARVMAEYGTHVAF